MSEPKNTRRSEVPELVEDDDILSLDESEQEEKTGEYFSEEGQPSPGEETADSTKEPLPLNESDLDEDTSEVEKQRPGAEQDAGGDDDEELEKTANEKGGGNTPVPDRGEEKPPLLQDTLDEPLVSRRRRRPRRLSRLENEPQTAEGEPLPGAFADEIDNTPKSAETPPWQQESPPAAEKTQILGQTGPDEKTQILGQEDQQQPVYPVLVVLQGEEEGREIELVPDHITIGRGTDCDLVFPDIACSRRHATLERQGNRVTITDLRSGNGTLVNGKRVQQAELHDGDEIQVGTTLLRFQFSLASPAAAPDRPGTVTSHGALQADTSFLGRLLADPARRKLILFGGGGVLGLMLVLMVIKMFVPARPRGPTAEHVQKQREQEDRLAYDNHLETIKSYIAERRWQEAALEVQLAFKIRPGDSILSEYKAHIEKEQQADSRLREAAVAIGEKDFEKAIGLAKQVPADSVYSEKAVALVKECQQKIIDDIVVEGRKLMEQKNYAQAALKFDEALRQNPEDESALKGKVEAEKKLAEENARLAMARKNKQRHVVKRPRPKTRGDSMSEEVLALYRKGDLERAIGKADSEGASRQVALLKKVQVLMEQGRQLARSQGESAKAVGYLEEAYKLDQSIAKGSGKVAEELRDLLSKCYFLQGADAKLAKRYPEAYKAFRKAESFGNQMAAKNLDDLKKIAKRLYEEAYIIKASKPEEAIGKLEVVIQIIPADDPYYGKAQRVLNQLRNPGAASHESEGEF